MTPTVRPFGAALRMLMLLMGLIGFAQTADAACNTPAGAPGDMTYSTSANVMVYCDGSNWISMAGGVSLTVNTAGGGATPYGSTGDVQINSSGALGGDTGNFKYSASTLYAPNLNVSGNVTASTVNASGLGTFGSILDNGGLTVLGAASMTTVSASTISTTLLQLSPNTATACTTTTAGAQRYNSVSNTIDYCSGSAWLSLGPSATAVPAFSVNKGGTNQTVTAGTATLLTWSTENFDTNNNFASNRFTPTIPGKYLLILTVNCTSLTSNQACSAIIKKNGAGVTLVNARTGNYDTSAMATAIVDMNGVTDYAEAFGLSEGTTISGAVGYTSFQGILISMAGGGSGGTATPAGSTNDVQFNSGGLLAADTGKFTYASNLLSTPAISATTGTIGANSGFATSMTFTVSGNIFIPSTSNAALSNSLFFGDDTLSGKTGLRLSYNTPQQIGVIDVSGTGGLQIRSALAANTTTNLMTFTSATLVGVGTAAPAAKLDVNGEIKVGNAGLACSNQVSGSIRYNMVSSTIDYCAGGAWQSLGTASGTATLGLLAYSAATQSIPNNTLTTITDFTTIKRNDFGAGSFSSGVFTVPAGLGGWYHMTGHYNVNACSTAVVAYIKVGSTVIAQNEDSDNNTGGCVDRSSVDAIYYLSAGDTVSFQVSQVSGAAHNTTTLASLGIVRFSDGVSSGGSGGGTANPAGSTNDVQFNSGGLLAADTNNFTYTSSTGVLKAPSLLTGGMTATGQASLTTISSTLLQLVSNSTAACTAGLAGGQRYNDTNAVIEFCNGTSWTTVGPSFGASLTAFTVYNNATQTVANNGTAAWNVALLNNGGAFSTSTGRFTAPATGLYFFIGTFLSNADKTNVDFRLFKNGVDTGYRSFNGITGSTNTAAYAPSTLQGVLSLVAGDKVDVRNISGVAGSLETTVSRFSGFIINAGTGSSGGTANPAGSTADIQFNTSGALDADTGLFTYTKATGNLSATTISTTVVNIASVSTIANVVGGGGNIISSGSTAVSTSSAGSITFYTGNSQRAVIDTNGNVGINATNPTGKLHIMQLSQGTLGLLIGNSTYSTAAFNAMGMQVNDSGQTIIRGGWSAAKDIILNDNGGGVLAGMSTAYTDGIIGLSPLQANAKTSGHAGITVKVESGAASTPMIGFANSNGTVGTISTNGSATAYNTSSDRRLKENIVTTREGLQKLMSIGVMDFNFRKDPSKTVVQGFIAQDLNKIYPEAVTVGDDGKDVKKQWQVDYGRITPLVVKAVQDLNIKTDDAVKSLKADNDNFRAELKAANDNIAELRKQVDALRRAR